MLFLAIPAHNEVATIGVLLWRLRTVLAEFPREYEVVVYDDASNDETADVAEQYAHAMPVTVIRGKTPVGYAKAVDALVRHIAAQTRYPRRDAMLLLQADFTDPPGLVPEFARRFEGGADLVVGERTAVVDAPVPVRRLFKAAAWALKPFVRVDGVHDLMGSMRLVRISALRDLIRAVGDAPVCAGDSWTANADLLLNLVPHARRIEAVPLEPTYGVRTRETRRITVRDALAALRWGWGARGRRATQPPAEGATEAPARTARGAAPARRRDEPEVTVDRLRERSKERDRLRGDSDAPPPPRARRDMRPERERVARDVSGDHQGEVAEEAPRDTKRDAQRDTQREMLREPTRQEMRESKRPLRREDRKSAGREEREDGKDARRSSRRDEARRDEPRPPREGARPAAGRTGASSTRGRSAPLDLDENVLPDDPFAGRPARPERSKSPAPAVDPDTERPSDSPYADDEAATVAPVAAAKNEPTRRPPRSAVVSDETDADDATAADGDDASADQTDDDGEDAEGGSPSDARERKRRRNRRSRRRRSKKRTDGEGATTDGSDDASDEDGGEARAESGDSAVGDRASGDSAVGDSASGDATERAPGDDSEESPREPAERGKSRRGRGRGRGRNRAAAAEGEDRNTSDSERTSADSDSSNDDGGVSRADRAGDSETTSDSDGGDDSEEGRAARGKRRGRRGRRGGMRRSRGKNREDGGAEGGADGDGGSGNAGGGDASANASE